VSIAASVYAYIQTPGIACSGDAFDDSCNAKDSTARLMCGMPQSTHGIFVALKHAGCREVVTRYVTVHPQ